jgi:DNA repair protein RadC
MYARRDKDQPLRYLKKFEIVETETALPIQGQVQDPDDLLSFFSDLQNGQVPKIIAIYLDDNLLFLGHQVFVGATPAAFETQMLYHYFSLFLAKRFILLLNHTSGDSTPTEEDLKLMRSLIVDSSALSFTPCFADYIIVGDTKYYSMSLTYGISRPEDHEEDIKKGTGD